MLHHGWLNNPHHQTWGSFVWLSVVVSFCTSLQRKGVWYRNRCQKPWAPLWWILPVTFSKSSASQLTASPVQQMLNLFILLMKVVLYGVMIWIWRCRKTLVEILFFVCRNDLWLVAIFPDTFQPYWALDWLASCCSGVTSTYKQRLKETLIIYFAVVHSFPSASFSQCVLFQY